MTPWLLLGLYCVLVIAGSLFGGWLPTVARLTHTQLQVITSFVAGLMLGVGIFHLFPHGYELLAARHGGLDEAMLGVMSGILVMFFMLRAFHFHAHDVPKAVVEPASHDVAADDHCDHGPHGHDHAALGYDSHERIHGLSWFGVAAGLSLHTMIDGMALAASIQGEAVANHDTVFPLGLGTFLAILLHKPLDALSITILMLAAGWTAKWRNAVNAGFALMCPLGAFAFYGYSGALLEHQHFVVGTALAFSAGVFICISLSDLLPEIEFHSHDRIKLSVALLLGVVLAYAIIFLEPTHIHGRPSIGDGVSAALGSN
jgi:zinc and cadmium transporter